MDEHASEQEKIRQMNGRQRLGYFKDYYLVPFLVLLGVLLLVLFYLFTAATVMFLEDGEIDTRQLAAELTMALELDETDLSIAVEQMSPNAAKSQTAFLARVAAGDVDILIADKEVFAHFASLHTFQDLREILPDAVLEKYSGELYSCEVQVIGMDGTVQEIIPDAPYGIEIKKAGRLQAYTEYLQDPVIGVIVSADDLEEERELLQYLLE